MLMFEIPFGTTAWDEVERTEHPGETGRAFWRTRQFGDLRVRMVEYSPGYLADHWCSKGHIVLCVEGELQTELKDGRILVSSFASNIHRMQQAIDVGVDVGRKVVVVGRSNILARSSGFNPTPLSRITTATPPSAEDRVSMRISPNRRTRMPGP